MARGKKTPAVRVACRGDVMKRVEELGFDLTLTGFTPEWTDMLRPGQLLLEPFCRECARRGLRTPATRVDHKDPHRGDWAKFTDSSNLQSLCERHHNQKTALEMAERQRKLRQK